MNTMHKLDYVSPIGVIEITGTAEGIYSIMFVERSNPQYLCKKETPSVLLTCSCQLDDYFSGKRQKFTISYILDGTLFQRSVWHALTEVPYAQTRSYKEIAASIENEKAVRAVGMTNGKNKISIVIPCHRVIGSNGKLTGYAGGLWRKKWLLQHEEKFK